MRLFSVAVIGFLSLVVLGCSSAQTQQVFSDADAVLVDGVEPDLAEVAEGVVDSEADVADADAAEGVVDSEPDVADPDAAEGVADTEAEIDAEPDAAEDVATGDGLFPTVVGATAATGNGTSWQVNVTLSSTYDSPQRYADAWRVLDADDNELGIRVLTHDHANEQPFTRSTSVDIPEEVDVVFIEGRDLDNGWSGERFELALSR